MIAKTEIPHFDGRCWPDVGAEAPCSGACPIGTDTSGYIMAIYMGNYDEAYRILSRANPLPGVCSRVCHHPCEDNCVRKNIEAPVSIRALKRFAVEHASVGVLTEPPEVAATNGRRVAVVGSGPAGLAAAHLLRQKGYGVTVFERNNRVGGLLASAIPPFILPHKVLECDLKRIEAMGIEFKTGTEIKGREGAERLMRNGYSAVLLTIGASEAGRLKNIPYTSEKVKAGLSYLQEMISDPQLRISGRVVVLGGGNVAMDVARLCVRRGIGQVSIYAIEEKDVMPAFDLEKKRTEQEGVIIHGGWGFTKVKEKEGVLKIDFSKVKEIKTKNRTLTPILDNSQTCTDLADTLIVAVGQKIELSSLEGLNAEFTPSGTVATEDTALAMPGVFVAGDVVIYPGTVTEAMANGQKAAEAIDVYLQGTEPIAMSGKRSPKVNEEILSRLPKKDRQVMPEIGLDLAKSTTAEIEIGFSEIKAREEASRCINCPVCGNCIMVKHQICREAATRLSLR